MAATFEIDVTGLAELEGGKPAHRLAFEPVANVFDEFRGYGGTGAECEDCGSNDIETSGPDHQPIYCQSCNSSKVRFGRKKPTYCALSLEYSSKPRGVWLTVADDGAGFDNPEDIWTFFGTTAKRSVPGVSGRFNAGDKQLLSLAREAEVKTNNVTVAFVNGDRDVTRHRTNVIDGTVVKALMPWTREDMASVRNELSAVIPPAGLSYTVDGVQIKRGTPKCRVHVSLPTVALIDGVMKTTVRKSRVDVVETNKPQLCELGLPVCSLGDVGFPWTLDVQQKVPVPISRDMVATSYLYRLIGTVIEQATMDGHQLLTEDQEGAGFLRDAMDWIREPEALVNTIKSVYGENSVRRSSDPVANGMAELQGAPIISGRLFTPATRKRLDAAGALPTSKERFGGMVTTQPPAEPAGDGGACPLCGRS